jgi:hypothetical protein
VKQTLVCVCCKKSPAELEEYVEAAKDEGVTPDAYVLDQEGTLNTRNGHFWCTACYVNIGMPLGVAP